MIDLKNSSGVNVDPWTLPEILACDIETTGLDYAYDDIHILQLGTDNEQYYTYEITLELFLFLKTRKLIFHGGKFDTEFLANQFGELLDIYGDTLVMLHASGYTDSYELKDAAPKILGVKNWNNSNKFDLTYALKDVKYTYMLADRLLENMDEEDFTVYTHELMGYSAFRMIEITGTYIGDISKSDAIIEKMLLEHEIENRLDLSWINSRVKLAKLLYDGLGLPILERTGKGAPSTKYDILIELNKRGSKLAGEIASHSKTMKLRTFFKSWNKLQIDGKIRPKFNIMARTGRTTSKEPNLQQVPQNSYVRNMIVAPPGWKFIEADYSQLELRCAAFCAQDKTMLAAYENDEDLHDKTWYAISNGSPYSDDHDIAKRQRTIAKSCNFSLLYGASWSTLQSYVKGYGMELTDDEAKEYHAKFFEGYPGLVAWHANCIKFAEINGYSRTPSGRKRYLEEIYSSNYSSKSAAQRQSINSPVQGLGSDLCVSAMTQITEHPEYGNTFLIYGTVHDAILVIAKEGHEEHVANDIIKYNMEHPRILKDIPNNESLFLKADIEICQSWGGGNQQWV